MKLKRQAVLFLLVIASLVLSSCRPGGIASPTAASSTTKPIPASKFVAAANGKFYLDGHPYYFIGANFWQGMNLGVDGPSGNRALLVRDLDTLQQLGVTNLRVMASSEGPNSEPHRMVPALMVSPGVYDPAVLDGLDYLIAEMGKRNMKAVMVLNNYWQWSGGMGQYVSWAEKSPIPYPGNYNTFMTYVAKFYACTECQTWYRAHIQTIIDHTNPYTGLKYRDDPTIFAWELANEPRRYPVNWIDDTAAYIKSLDPNHMVTTGSEGSPPGESQNFILTHSSPDIDYATIHIWPQNWGWFDPSSPESYDNAERLAIAYFQQHAVEAASLDKPLVLEEFGLARDWDPLHDIYNPSAPTTYRDKFYTAMFDQVTSAIAMGEPVAGANFWAWSGQARPGYPWIGDPPHETAGWYSVYDTDSSTLAILSDYAARLAKLNK
ncbi:MAG TPA: beta-mannosidase [Anaerolineales bacterium]|nr:beta-mannosidase [Anaerolineales bacterium]